MPEPAAPPPAAGQSYLEIVWRQFFRNRLAVAAVWVTLALFLAAIFAPLLANGRPLVMRGAYPGLYRRSFDDFVEAAHPELVALPDYAARLRARWADPAQLSKREFYDAFLGYDNALLGQLNEHVAVALRTLKANPRWQRGDLTCADLDAALTQAVTEGRRLLAQQEQPLPEAPASDPALADRIAETLTAIEDANDEVSRLESEKDEFDRRQRAGESDAGEAAARERLLTDLVNLRRRLLVWEGERGVLVGTYWGRRLPGLLERGRARLDAMIERERAARLGGVESKLAFLLAHAPDDVAARARPLAARYQELGDARFVAQAAARAAPLAALQDELATLLDPERVALPSRLFFPALRTLGPTDLFFLTAALALACSPLWLCLTPWRRRPRPHRVLRALATAIALGGLAWLVMALFVPKYQDPVNYHKGVERGDLRIEWAVWPPIRYGHDDYDHDRLFQPPLTGGSHGRYLLGTDGQGHDLLARLIWGGRISLSIGFVSVALSVFIGVIVGSLAGYFGGWVDLVISRVIEIVICFPSLFLILAIVAIFGPSIWYIILVIGLTGWTGIARLTRGEFLRLRKQDFVIAGVGLGFGPLRVIFRHILPNAMAPVLVSAAFGIASAILIESSLSFLGFGDTSAPSWGGILTEARTDFNKPWITFAPGFLIFLSVTVYNLVGEGLRDALDPKLRQ